MALAWRIGIFWVFLLFLYLFGYYMENVGHFDVIQRVFLLVEQVKVIVDTRVEEEVFANVLQAEAIDVLLRLHLPLVD